MPTSNDDTTPRLFEDDLSRLEAIVRDLETGDLSLEDSLRVFEEGTKLTRHLGRVLDEADRKIQVLMESTNDGPPRLAPFEPDESP